MKCLFIINSLSGRSKNNKYKDYLISSLNKKYEEVKIFVISKNNFYNYNNINDFDDVVIAGGDGSISLAINELIKHNFKGNVGYIPLGTANDFAYNHKIKKGYKKPIEILFNNNIENIYLGSVNDRVMLYALSLGDMSKISYETSLNNKRFFKKFSYVLTGIKSLLCSKVKTIKLKSSHNIIEYQTILLLVIDSYKLGGFKVNRHNKNKYDVLIFKKGLKGRIGIVFMFLFGYKKKNTFFYDYLNLKEFDIELDNNDIWCIDGESYESNLLHIRQENKYIKLYKKTPNE